MAELLVKADGPFCYSGLHSDLAVLGYDMLHQGDSNLTYWNKKIIFVPGFR